MKYFTDVMHDLDSTPAQIRERFDAYFDHLEQIRSQMPPQVYEFAAAPWHYDDGTLGLHDSWVETLTIREPSMGTRQEERYIEIDVELLSAYHNRLLHLRYLGVRKYKLQTPSRFKYIPSYKTGHGDWLYDEFNVSKAGYVIHEVRFSRGSTWCIECSDIEFKSTPVKRK